MLRTLRWYYEKEPVWPPGKHNRNSWFKKRTLYSEIIKTVKDNQGTSTGEGARKLGKSYYYISPLLFLLRSFGSLRSEQVGCERINALEAFSRMPCVVQMLSKLSREKNRGPWLRRLFRYQEWLIGKGYFGARSRTRFLATFRLLSSPEDLAAGTRSAHNGARSRHAGRPRPDRQSRLGRGPAASSVLSSPLSSRARRSLSLRRQSTPSARRRSATWRLRRGSPCR
jgi:hypothetical protein